MSKDLIPFGHFEKFNPMDFRQPYVIVIENSGDELAKFPLFAAARMLSDYAGKEILWRGDGGAFIGKVEVKMGYGHVKYNEMLYTTMNHPLRFEFMHVEAQGNVEYFYRDINTMLVERTDANGDYAGTLVHLLADPHQVLFHVKATFCDFVIDANTKLEVTVPPQTKLTLKFYERTKIVFMPKRKWWYKLANCINRIIQRMYIK